jgi:hypothetical protein
MDNVCPEESFYIADGPEFITLNEDGYLNVEPSAYFVSHTGCFDVGVAHVSADSSEETFYRTVCV